MKADHPILARPSEDSLDSDSSDNTAPTGLRKILVVDDDEATRRLEALVLAHAGYRVRLAVDGEDAWNLLLEENYDLLLTDEDMPRLSGLALIARFRAAGMRLPVILVSGSVTLSEVLNEPKLRLSAVLRKPFGLSDLLGVTRAILPLPPAAPPGTILQVAQKDGHTPRRITTHFSDQPPSALSRTRLAFTPCYRPKP